MQSNYDRLFQELSGLIDDREVYDSLDEDLRGRVDSLLTYNTRQSPSRTINDLSCNDTEHLFTKNNNSYSQLHCESAVLKDTTNSNNPKRKHTLNSSGKITAKKIETSAFEEERKTDKAGSKNKSLNKSKANNKSSRDLIKYHMQTSKSKSKEKERVLRKGPETASKKMISHVIQRNIDNVSPFSKAERQGKKAIGSTIGKTEKKSSLCLKNPKSEQNSMLFHSKMKTASSNLCESREIIKKLATIQTEQSRLSFSGSKTHSREKRSFKAPLDKQVTVMQAILRKQQTLNIEKRQSQSQIKALQDLIDKERNRLDLTNINIAKVNYEITKKQLHERGCSQQIKISRKKSENFISESRQIQSHILQVNKSRDSITASIEEEKYLINMYLTVIEEIKSQLRIEQSQKIDLIKRLVTVKNTQKMCMEKYLSKQAASEQIFRQMSESMKKWV